jgi:hypothetical protein
MALDLLTPVSDTHRRDLIVSDTGMVDPDDSDHLKAGEWVGLDSSGHAQGSSDGISSGNAVKGEGPFYQVFGQKGDMAAQALGKICVIMSLDYEAETDMYEDGETYAAGTLLTLGASPSDTGGGATGDTTRHILTPVDAVTDVVIAMVTVPPSVTASGKLRFQRLSPYTQN